MPPVTYGANRPNGNRPVKVTNPPPAKFVFAARPSPSMQAPKYLLQKYFTSTPPPKVSSRPNNSFLLTWPRLTCSLGFRFFGSQKGRKHGLVGSRVSNTNGSISKGNVVPPTVVRNGSSFGTANCPVSEANAYD